MTMESSADIRDTLPGLKDWAPKTMLVVAAPFILIAAMVAFSIVAFPLSEPDETRYAEIAREMVATGDWVIPRVSGSPYVDKPPLLFWATAVCFEVGGIHPVTARLPVVLAALACVILTWWWANRLYGRWIAWLTALILATSPLFFALGQHLLFDMPLAFFVTLALVGVWRGLEASSRAWILVAWTALALGILTKGPVAVILVGGTTAAHLLFLRNRSAVRTVLDPVGIGLAVLITMPWFVAAEIENPGFLSVFFLHHHLQRFIDPWHHQEPWWYYLACLPLVLFPWSILAFLGAVFGRIVRVPSRWSPITRFLVIWAGGTVLFFSFSDSKIVTYILPAMPPLAMLSARVISKATVAARSALGGTGLVMAAGGFVVGLTVVARFPRFYQEYGISSITVGTAAAGCLLLTGLGVTLLARLGLPRDAFAVLTAGTVLFLGCAVAGRHLATSYDDLAAVIGELSRTGDTIVSYEEALYGIALTTGHNTTFVLSNRHSDEGERRALWGERDASWLIERWKSGGRLFVVADSADLDALSAGLDPSPQVIGRARDKVLVVNFPSGPLRGESSSVASSETGSVGPAQIAGRHSAGMPSTSTTP